MKRTVHSVPWHPEFRDRAMPGWMVHLMGEACRVIAEKGGLVMGPEELRLHLMEVWINVEGHYTPMVIGVEAARGLAKLLVDFAFIRPIQNAPGGRA